MNGSTVLVVVMVCSFVSKMEVDSCVSAESGDKKVVEFTAFAVSTKYRERKVKGCCVVAF